MNGTRTKLSADTLKKLAKAYETKGYKVLYDPSETDLPAFLRTFRPDMIAMSKNDNVVVEVRSRTRVTGSEDVIKLAELIESKPGWRYELIIDRPTAAERIKIIRSKPALVREEIATRLSTARQLLEDGQSDSALLVGWTAAEAVFRHLLFFYDIPIDNLKPSYLIKTLYSNGILGWRAYELIQKAFSARNEVAHGFKPESIDDKTIKRFLKLIIEKSTQLDDIDSHTHGKVSGPRNVRKPSRKIKGKSHSKKTQV